MKRPSRSNKSFNFCTNCCLKTIFSNSLFLKQSLCGNLNNRKKKSTESEISNIFVVLFIRSQEILFILVLHTFSLSLSLSKKQYIKEIYLIELFKYLLFTNSILTITNSISYFN